MAPQRITIEILDKVLLAEKTDAESFGRQALNLRPVHQQIIHLFSASVCSCYLFDQ